MVYEVSEDTYLMNEALKKYTLKEKKVLEVGCGNCFNANFCAKQGAEVFALDVDPNAKKFCDKKVKFVLSDMFDNLREKDFDLIFFNPPYLVSDEIKYIDLDGGKKGRQLIDKFLEEFDKYIKEKGIALLLQTDYNDLEETKQKLKRKGYNAKIIKNLKLFFEELFVLEITKIF